MKEKIIIVAAILVGAWVGNRIRLPSGYLTGGLILGLVAKGIVGGNVPYGGPMSLISQLLVAYILVATSNVESIGQRPEVIPIALAYVLALLAFTTGIAFLLNKVFHIDLLTAIYGTAPGGLSGMAITAVDAGAETAISAVFQVLRIILVMIATPLLAALLSR
jgi:membrane AbrB-like protein